MKESKDALYFYTMKYTDKYEPQFLPYTGIEIKFISEPKSKNQKVSRRKHRIFLRSWVIKDFLGEKNTEYERKIFNLDFIKI